ncbi:cation diffusion facilitator CzcD-associated flavoprotein CzcO [Paenibacillus sp. SORGH_AS306]|uniref:FAD/NAD(P)-binding protein n=1 Tax=unclassified Paenibacillus TaxID=185978 RepID=UPI0027818F45|nr:MULTISPECIES: FAD/NAD(P)-binding protein [unclassified Paenibacillus]MDQ1233401.1 cation diffusion facilitator CzcD-associated flavoprotein CzcO [Paenibacillus sp. SORGH_AS_0306]MDR6110441.1 cation diffusion facilitator CzcD-associated flavoprotein CzcO [Paenibacillus sp. SORGH_AS_0338]
MSLAELNQRVKTDLSYLAYGGADWVRPLQHPEGHVYDVVIVGGGQSGLGAGFGLLRERISNILIIDENKEGVEGPWETYARMVTLRTPKHLTSIDLGIPSLTFRSWWEAQTGAEGWEAVNKIPRGDWMNYLRWYRQILNLPVRNHTRLKRIEPTEEGIHRLHIESTQSSTVSSTEILLARKVVLATGIQGGGEWHVPPMIRDHLPAHLYAHTSANIDFEPLRGKKVAVLGGGASAFDNTNFALSQGVGEAHVFVRREHLPRINPIRQMEVSGMIERFAALQDEDKYAAIGHFFKYNQPPTNDTFERASAWDGFQLHLGAPWLKVEQVGDQAVVTTPQGTFSFDFLIISTGLLSDPALRPELQDVESYIARWSDKYTPPAEVANPLLDAHPYLSPGFALQSRDEVGKDKLHGLYVFNYSALVSCGLSASAISGMRFAIPKLVGAIADELFLDDRADILHQFFAYAEDEFIGQWPKVVNTVDV